MKKRTARSWTKKELSQLGKLSDAELARQIGVTTTTVRTKRCLLGIPPLRPRDPMKWRAKDIALLGKRPDFEVARMLGIYRKAVINKRHELGIPSYARTSEFWHTWTKREISMLGKMTDRELAERIGIQPMCVTSKRRLVGVPAFIKHEKHRPGRRLDDWTTEETALLGTMADREVAERINVSWGAVRKKRISLGIEPFRQGGGWPHGIWTEAVLSRLGKVPHSVIARDIGVSRERVRQKCQELGIPRRFSRGKSNQPG